MFLRSYGTGLDAEYLVKAAEPHKARDERQDPDPTPGRPATSYCKRDQDKSDDDADDAIQQPFVRVNLLGSSMMTSRLALSRRNRAGDTCQAEYAICDLFMAPAR